MTYFIPGLCTGWLKRDWVIAAKTRKDARELVAVLLDRNSVRGFHVAEAVRV